MKKTSERTQRIIHASICIVTMSAIVFAAEVLWTEYHDWRIAVVLFGAFILTLCSMVQGFDVSEALETIAIQNESLRRRAEIIRKQKEIMDKYDTAIVVLYGELQKTDPENSTLKTVEQSLFGNTEKISGKISEK